MKFHIPVFRFCASLSILKYESMDGHSADKEVSPGRESGIDDAKLVRALVGSTNSDPAEHDGRGVIDKVRRDCVRNVNCGGMW